MAEAIALEDLIDQYKVEQHIAEKRYTDLYLAYDVDEDRLVDLDILQPEISQQASFASQFTQRARAIAQIRHPNIPRVYSVSQTSTDLPYVAQSHVDAYPLAERLAQLARLDTPVNSIYALKLVRQVAEALLLADRLDLLHYDLRPHNVLLKNVALPSDDSVLLADLYVPFERQAWPADGTVADVGFLSPEQRSGKQIDAASHVYSLGALLFQLLAGQPPPEASGRGDVVARRLTAGLSPLEKVRPGLSAQTYVLVDHALRKDPGQRYETIEQLVVALDEALLAEEARVGAPAATLSTSGRRVWAWLVSFLITSLILVATLLAVAMVRSRPNEQAPVVMSQATAVRADTTQVAAVPAGGESGDVGGGAAGDQPAPEGGDAGPAVVVPPPEPSATATEPPTEEPATLAPASATPSATATLEPTATATMPPTMTPTRVPRVSVALNSAFLRRGPGTFYPQAGVMLNGETAEVLALWGDDVTGWYLVQTAEGLIAWLAASVSQPVDGVALVGMPTPATVPPSPTPTQTATPTTTPTVAPTATTPPSGGNGGGDGGDDGGSQPTAIPQPTEAPIEPTKTPPPLP